MRLGHGTRVLERATQRVPTGLLVVRSLGAPYSGGKGKWKWSSNVHSTHEQPHHESA